MGLDTPTPGSSSASNCSQHSQNPNTGGGFDPFGGDRLGEVKKEEVCQGSGGEDDNFPEDLNGLEGIGPLANLTNTSGTGSAALMDTKVEPYFTFTSHHHPNVQTPASANGHIHSHQTHSAAFNGPGSAPPAGPYSTDSGHSSAGADLHRPSSSQNRLIIRDPFAPEQPPFLQSPNGQEKPLHPMFPPLNWDGKPPANAKSMVEIARTGADPKMVPLPNLKEGSGILPLGIYPQWSYHNYNNQSYRQWLEQIYPAGTFNGYWGRWSQMPMPPMIRPALVPIPRPGLIVLMPAKPGFSQSLIPPAMFGKIPPNCIPMVYVPSPNGLITVPLVNLQQAVAPHPGIVPPPPTQQMTPNTATNNNNSNSGGSGGKSTGGSRQTKPKKETKSQKKQREKEEQLREQMEQQQQQAQAMGKSPLEGGPIPPQPSQFYGAPGPMPGSFQQQQDMFKIPGRSPPLKRCNSSQRNSVPLSLTPMPDQRIHSQGLCCQCQTEINPQRRAIQCTAISQGCNSLFHWDCAGLSAEAFAEFIRDSRLEWICQHCFLMRNKEQSLMFAC